MTGLPRDPPLAAFGEVGLSHMGLKTYFDLAVYTQTQAQEVADYFRALPVEERPTAIFSSPFGQYMLFLSHTHIELYRLHFKARCLQTSKPIAKALKLPIFVEHGTYIVHADFSII